jgi:hypothetical protein
MVNVQNLENGKIIQIIITGELDDPSLFLVLSTQAADALGVERADTARVRVSPVLMAGAPLFEGVSDLPYSSDPDINPAARAGDVNALVEKRPLPDTGEAQKSGSVAAPEALPDTVVIPSPPVPEPIVIPHEEQPSISNRIPPTGGDIGVPEGPFADIPEEKPAISERLAANRDPGINEGWTLIEQPEYSDLVNRIEDPKPVSPAEGLPLPGAPEDLIITLEPAGPRPPAVAETPAPAHVPIPAPAPDPLDSIIASIPETATPKEPEAIPETAVSEEGGSWARQNLPLVASLAAKSYYLQVATYSNPQRAKPVVDSLTGVYPVVVLSGGEAEPLYRVMVGPVNEDERGVILYKLRAQGYTDAFLREGN